MGTELQLEEVAKWIRLDLRMMLQRSLHDGQKGFTTDQKNTRCEGYKEADASQEASVGIE